VFAARVSTRKLPQDFIELFNKANAEGLQHIDAIAASIPFDLFDLSKYYRFHLSYHLDERKKQGMAHFLQVISEK